MDPTEQQVLGQEEVESRWEAAPAVVAVIALQLLLALVSKERAQAGVLQRRIDVLSEAPHLTTARRVGPQEPIVEPQSAQGQAPRTQQTPRTEVHELQAAAADVKHDAVLDRQPVHRTEKPLPRFLGAIGNVDPDTDPSGTVNLAPMRVP